MKAEVTIRVWVEDDGELHIAKNPPTGESKEARGEVNELAMAMMQLAASVYDPQDISSIKVNGENIT